MIDMDNILEKMDERKKIHEKLRKEGVNQINDKLRSDKYTVESIIADSELGYKYHDLLDSKDLLNSEFNRNVNKTLHNVDVELYKLNKKIDANARKLTYDFDKKKETVLKKLLY